MAKTHPRLHVGDTRTTLSRTLKQNSESGVLTAVDLTTLTVNFKMINKATGATVVSATTATKDNAATGQVSYDLPAAAVTDAGIFLYYFIVVDGSETDHFPSEAGDNLLYIDSDTQTAEAAYEAAVA